MKRIYFCIALAFSIIAVYAQPIPTDSMYLGQIPPGNTPKAFNLPVSSGLRPVERITITSDNKEIYFGELDIWPSAVRRIKCYKYLDNKWQGPTVIFESFVAPALSANDSVMYMEKDLNGVSCTFYSTRNNAGWTTPVRLLSTNMQSHYFHETNLKNYYLASTPGGNSDICRLIINNSDTTIQSLGSPINTSATENDFFIARDESYIIFFRYSSPYDLYISFNNNNGGWTNPKTLGTKINTSIYEVCPFVTKDNKYLFFTRGGNDMPSYFTYWVRFDHLIDSLKKTNFIPYLKTSIPNQNDSVGHSFIYTITDTAFIDDDGNNTLTYSATLSNGNPLPSWLHFDAITKTFSGIPDTLETFLIKVTVTDAAKVSVNTQFTLEIKDNPTLLKSRKELNEKDTFFNTDRI